MCPDKVKKIQSPKKKANFNEMDSYLGKQTVKIKRKKKFKYVNNCRN